MREGNIERKTKESALLGKLTKLGSEACKEIYDFQKKILKEAIENISA
jgi:hypothetical protein